MSEINIAIIDDHKMVREGLRQLLEFEGDINVIAEAGNGEEGYKVIKTDKPDVVLLDINMPVMNGLELLKKVRMENDQTRILILTKALLRRGRLSKYVLSMVKSKTIKVRIDYPKQEKKVHDRLNIKISLNLKYIEK